MATPHDAPHVVPSEDARFPLDHPGWGRLEAAMAPRCAWCVQPDGHRGRRLVHPAGWREPMHVECLAEIDRWGCD